MTLKSGSSENIFAEKKKVTKKGKLLEIYLQLQLGAKISLQSFCQLFNQRINADAKYEELNFCLLFSRKDGEV